MPPLTYLDPALIDRMFSEGIPYQDITPPTTRWEDFQPVFSRLPALEQDIVTLFYKFNKLERHIGKILGLTQSAVSIRLKRARERLQYLRDVEQLPMDSLRALAKRGWRWQRLLQTVESLLRTTNQMETGMAMGVKQCTVSARIKNYRRTMTRLLNKIPGDHILRDGITILDFVCNGHRKLHEIVYQRYARPSFVRFTEEQAIDT